MKWEKSPLFYYSEASAVLYNDLIQVSQQQLWLVCSCKTSSAIFPGAAHARVNVVDCKVCEGDYAVQAVVKKLFNKMY